jgi:hypothetical protein
MVEFDACEGPPARPGDRSSIGRALDCGSSGCGFEPHRSPQRFYLGHARHVGKGRVRQLVLDSQHVQQFRGVSFDVEDWQEWQIQAEQIAARLNEEVSVLSQSLNEATDPVLRGFWPKLKDLKERVRTAPAIQLEDKLELERRLRNMGSRAYKTREAAQAQSNVRRDELLAEIQEIQASIEATDLPRDLRERRRGIESIRGQFDQGVLLVPADRQLVWTRWRETNEALWKKLTGAWEENEVALRALLDEARASADAGNAEGARRAAGSFYEELRNRECRGNAAASLKSDLDAVVRALEQTERQKAADRQVIQRAQVVPPVEDWRTEVGRNRESIDRLAEEVDHIERQVQESGSVLEQAMLRGTAVGKRRKLTDLERANKALVQRIDATEESPLISTD